MKLDYQPDAVVITLSKEMMMERGYKNWLREFLETMAKDEWTYWFRTSGRPKHEVPWLYIVVGGKVRFRCNLVMTDGPGEKVFNSGRSLFGRGWLVCAGPVVRPPKGHTFPWKGFQGFRYTEKLF